jgi:hypothetical protein
MKKKQTANIIIDSARITWKRRPSEIRGYHRALYITTDEGDYLRVDYNLKDKRVRLYVEVAREGGSPYYSVISNGRITSEKSVSTGRSFGFAGKFQDRADIFSTIPNREVVKLINKNYKIGVYTEGKVSSAKRQRELEETRQRYFKANGLSSTAGYADEDVQLFGRLKFVDVLDFFIGFILSAVMFLLFQYSLIAMGVVLAFFGIIIGIVDMFIRGRSPIFIKVILFILLGAFAYIYGYFYY